MDVVFPDHFPFTVNPVCLTNCWLNTLVLKIPKTVCVYIYIYVCVCGWGGVIPYLLNQISHLTTSGCIKNFISPIMYKIKPGTIFSFHEEMLHYFEVPRGSFRNLA